MSRATHKELSIFRGWRDVPRHWRAVRSWSLWTNKRIRIVLLFCRPERDEPYESGDVLLVEEENA